MKKYLIILLIFFYGCENKYIVSVYDSEELSKPKQCLKLKLNPFSEKIYNQLTSSYHFSNKCNYTLQIRYKTQIACNSPYKTTDKFNAFIEYSLIKNNKLIATYYLDTTYLDFYDDLNKMFNDIQKLWHIKIFNQ